ncbi:MAG TPA: TadE/TadG family type IV pilus assembly protein [Candidatus Binatia bacterium]|jgi:hypothetical protein|nr:TadE/TadG family type IV pilus assembly protein [Candidatus Binatia bacterium]
MIARIQAKRHNVGQSLVETALFLPILIILLAGAVEVSNLLVTQNRVTTAARAATGFGAANFDGDDWEDPNVWAIPMANVARNNVTDTLDLSPDLWDIYTVKATLNPEADAFEEWNAQHAYGDNLVTSDTEWLNMEAQVKDDVLEALDPSQNGLEVVATIAFHDRHSLLGLNAFDLGAFTRVRGLSVMRVSKDNPYTVCSAFPIAVSLYNNSVWPAGSPNVPEGDEEFPFETSGNYGGQNYHWSGWPNTDPPIYEVGNTDQFPANVAGESITQAQPGYLYLTKQATESDSSGFGWLRWIHETAGGGGCGSNSSCALADSLEYPGNADTYHWEPWSNDGIDRFDPVNVSTGAVSSAKDIMAEHVDIIGRTLKLIVFTPSNIRGGDWNGDHMATGGTGSDLHYEIYGFVTVKVLAWYLPGNGNWLLFEFVSWSDTC